MRLPPLNVSDRDGHGHGISAEDLTKMAIWTYALGREGAERSANVLADLASR